MIDLILLPVNKEGVPPPIKIDLIGRVKTESLYILKSCLKSLSSASI